MKNFLIGFFAVIGSILLIFGVDLLIAYIFKLLWNWLLPSIFGIGTITFWQSFGIIFFISFIVSLFNRKK